MWYRFWEKIKDIFYYNPRNLAKKIFSRYHCSPPEIWEAGYTISQRILPVLKAFKEADKVGYPGLLATEDPEVGSKEWNEILDKIIFFFEWHLYHEEMIEYTKNKEAKAWLLKNGDPFNTKDPKCYHELPECLKSIGEEGLYHDDALEKKLYDKAQEGLELFKTYYLRLWD